MTRPLRLIALTLLCALPGSSSVQAAEIRVLCSNGLKAVMEDLAPQFQRATGNVVSVTYGLSAELSRRGWLGQFASPELLDSTVAVVLTADAECGSGWSRARLA